MFIHSCSSLNMALRPSKTVYPIKKAVARFHWEKPQHKRNQFFDRRQRSCW